MIYEYKVIPAPTKGLKAKGIKNSSDRFANALQTAINLLASDGWEYVRAETLPAQEREGLMSKTTVFQHLLIFRKPRIGAADIEAVALSEEPDQGGEDTLDQESERSIVDEDGVQSAQGPDDSSQETDPLQHEEAR